MGEWSCDHSWSSIAWLCIPLPFFFLKLVAHIKSLLAGSGVKKLTGLRVYQGIFICPTGQCGHLEYVSLLLFVSLAL